MNKRLLAYCQRPRLYEKSPAIFWSDKHISKKLLESHLNPNSEAASRNPHFISKSAAWISNIAPSTLYPNLLDLGCGPGIYAEQFHNRGYLVTGIDLSWRSILYAKKQAKLNKNNINYLYKNYLSIDYSEAFDIVTLIYCDYGALSTEDRLSLLKKVYTALKPNGKFIFDVFTSNQYKHKEEERHWDYCRNGGFWCDQPHLCLHSFYRYDEEDTVLRQTIVISKSTTTCYNVWEHFFTDDSLNSEVMKAGFSNIELFGDVAGKEYSIASDIICMVLSK